MSVLVAAATPWGHGALAVIRFSGDGLDAVLDRIMRPRRPGPWRHGRTRRVDVVVDDVVIDDGLVVVSRGPRTYTGEDTAELSCHGNPVIVDQVLHAAVDAGARLAGPGAFTRRAVEHGKLDLVRAEAVLQISRARTSQGVRVARDALDGRLSATLGELRTVLLDVGAELEARLDYPADELAFEEDEALLRSLASVADRASALAQSWSSGRVLVEGARVALVGAVNAGKSSLFNALVGQKRALVHETAGTTRDVLELSIVLDGVAVTLLDTAGERQTADPIEAAGLALARELVDGADLLVVVLRARADGPSAAEQEILERTRDRARLVVCNGVDRGTVTVDGAIETVAPEGRGVDVLARAIVNALVGEEPGHAGLVVASVRQRDLLNSVADAARAAMEALPTAGVAVAADEVTHGLEEIDALTGVDSREAVLDTLFARFCVGK